MEEIFTRKEGEISDGDEDYIHYLEKSLLNEGLREDGYFPKYKKDWKIKIIIEEICD